MHKPLCPSPARGGACPLSHVLATQELPFFPTAHQAPTSTSFPLPFLSPVTSVGSLPFSSRPHSAGPASCSFHLCLRDRSTPSYGCLQWLKQNIILSLPQLAWRFETWAKGETFQCVWSRPGSAQGKGVSVYLAPSPLIVCGRHRSPRLLQKPSQPSVGANLCPGLTQSCGVQHCPSLE